MNYYLLRGNCFISKENGMISYFISKTVFCPISIAKMMRILLARKGFERHKKLLTHNLEL